MTNLKHFLFTVIFLGVTATAAGDDTSWTDISSRYVTNATFQSDLSGWTDELSAGTKGWTNGCARFFNGSGRLTQQLTGLVKGRYRLKVQAFYRSTTPETAYPQWQQGTEQTAAYLVAGSAQTRLKSLFDETLSGSTVGWQSPDGTFFPNSSGDARQAFDRGFYWNEVEFEADGTATIGISCPQVQYNNWCVLDNFRLEYAIGGGSKQWVDVTALYLQNVDFDNGNADGWQYECSGWDFPKFGYGSTEFWNCTFNIWQTVKDAPQGRYRLSVQGYYRCKDNDGRMTGGMWQQHWVPGGYEEYLNNTHNITGYLYAGQTQQKLVSVYSESMDTWVDGSWQSDGKYFPNTMGSARVFFDAGGYWNRMEFDGGGTFDIGLRCDEQEESNWCIFDNFRLEYYTDIVPVTAVNVSIDAAQLVVGETARAAYKVEPAVATLPFCDWSTSNPQVVTVDRDGLVTAVGQGTAAIVATATDGSGVSGSVTVSVTRNPAGVGSLVINELMASNVDEFISPAFNFDGWVELYNPTQKAVELGGVRVSNTAETWTMPQTAGVVPAQGYKVVWFDSNDGNANNAPFKLDTDGGTVVFMTAAGQEIARQAYPAAMERTSYARTTDGGPTWATVDKATPGASNNGVKAAAQQLDAPVVNLPSQLFTGTLSVQVTIPAGTTLRYTTDGTLPTPENGATSANGRFTVDGTQCLRFRLFSNDGSRLPSRVTTRTYIYNSENFYLPVVSVVTDPSFLYDKEIGLFAKGPNGRPGNGQPDNCNWNMNWERPANFSFITADGQMALNQDVDIEMAGGWSRADTPHSFKLKGSKELGGNKNLNYPFFEQKPYIRNRTLQIRNGGGDVRSGRFKDPALQYILLSSGLDVDGQSYQPVHEFINGQYMGVLNMREPNNKHYVYANYGWDDDQIDQFEMSPDSGYVQKCGTGESWRDLMALSEDAANSSTYDAICQLLDIDAYINYMAAELYLCHWDWPQNNVKGFRNTGGGRYRFVVFDLDNALTFDYDPKIWGTPPFETFFNKGRQYTYDQLYPTSLGCITADIDFVQLFGNLLQNEGFKRRFIDAYCIMGGSVFLPERVNTIVDELQSRVQQAHSATSWSASNIKSGLAGHPERAIQRIKDFATFGLSASEPQHLTLTSTVEGARLFINDQEVPTGHFDGQLFPPFTLRAEAPGGYRFLNWQQVGGDFRSSSASTSLPARSMSLTVNFQKLTDSQLKSQGVTPVRINEVSGANDSFVDEYGKKGDWVELYNTTDEPVDVEGMYLSDNADKLTKYQISKGATQAQTVIPAHGYLLVWCDKRETTDRGLHASFKIADDGGLIALTAADKSWTDVLNYEAHDARTTVGRYPDGAATVYAMNVATIGKRNVYSTYVTAVAQTGLPVTPPTDIAAIGNDAQLRVAYGGGTLLAQGADGLLTVEVFRGDGQPVFTTTTTAVGQVARVSISHLPRGFYVARVIDGSGVKATCRFVK
jgi:hypothetical protein